MSNEPSYLAPSSANVEWSPYPEPVDWPIGIRIRHGDVTAEQLRRLTMSDIIPRAMVLDVDSDGKPDVVVQSYRRSPDGSWDDAVYQLWADAYKGFKKPYPSFKK